MINPVLMELLEKNDALDIFMSSVSYQLQKIHNVEKTNEGRDWYLELPSIIKDKFDNYRTDYEKLSRILTLGHDQIQNEMNKGYYYWRLLRSACITYHDDLVEYDQQLIEEFNLPETEAISNNSVLNDCIGILDQHVIEK